MKKIPLIISIIIASFFSNKAFAQTCVGSISIPNGPASCTVGGTSVNFYDSGDARPNKFTQKSSK